MTIFDFMNAHPVWSFFYLLIILVGLVALVAAVAEICLQFRRGRL